MSLPEALPNDPVTQPIGRALRRLRPCGEHLRPRSRRRALGGGRSTTSASSTASSAQRRRHHVEQFFDLNEKVGGFDVDANIVPAAHRRRPRRPRARLPDRAAHQRRRRPRVDPDHRLPRDTNDRLAEGDIHLRYHSFSMRERLREGERASTTTRSSSSRTTGSACKTQSPLLPGACSSRWIGGSRPIEADKRRIPQIEKVVRNKPADLQEGCNTRDLNNPTFIAQKQVRDLFYDLRRSSIRRIRSRARWLEPYIAADIIKCQNLSACRKATTTCRSHRNSGRDCRRSFPPWCCYSVAPWRGAAGSEEDTWIAFDSSWAEIRVSFLCQDQPHIAHVPPQVDLSGMVSATGRGLE